MKYYAYLYKDIDGTPIYAGKGIRRRAYRHKTVKSHLGNLLRKRLKEGHEILPLIFPCETEEQSIKLEKDLIKKYGRIDLGTGSLFNLTDGGEGTSGAKRTEEQNRLNSERQKAAGIKPPSRKGCKLTPEQSEFASKRLSGIVKKKPTAEMNLANSLRQKGKKQEQIECPCCGKIGGISNMKSRHIPKCQLLREN